MKKSVSWLIATLALVILIILCFPKTSYSEVNLSIRNDTYVFPPSEFEGTKAYPDIIEVENEYVEIELLPNRGITVWRILSKLTGNEHLYFNPVPRLYKDELTGKYYAEFGGFYPLYPWNERDNQPYMKNYEVKKKTSTEVEIYTWAEDIETGVRIEEWLCLSEESTLVKIHVKISNPPKKTLEFIFRDRLVACTGSRLTENTQLILPVDEVRVIKSVDEWMGTPGEVKEWPQSWSTWREWVDFGAFSTSELKKPFIAVINKDTGDVLIKTWRPTNSYKSALVRGWGPKYEDAGFPIPVVYLENNMDKATLSPGESLELDVYLYVVKGLDSIETVSEHAAGYLLIDKERCSAGEEFSVKVVFAVNSVMRDSSVKINVLNKDGSVAKELKVDALGAIGPEAPISKEYRFVNEGDLEGEYLIQALVMADGETILELKSSIYLEPAPFHPYYVTIAIVIVVIVAVVSIAMYSKRRK